MVWLVYRGILRAVLTRKKIGNIAGSNDDDDERAPQLIFATATLTKAVKSLLEEMSTGKPSTTSTMSSSTSSDDYNKIAVFDADFPGMLWTVDPMIYVNICVL